MSRFLKASVLAIALAVACQYESSDTAAINPCEVSMDRVDFLPYPFPPSGTPTKNQDIQLSSWDKLSRGRTIGKRIGIGIRDSGINATEQTSSLNMFEVSGDDSVAMPLIITLTPPEIREFTTSGELPNITGTHTNKQGTIADSAWLNPFVVLEWGSGGVSCRAEIDIHNGSKIAISASFVRIRAVIESPPADQGESDYQLGAFISPGFAESFGAYRTIVNPTSVPAASDTQFPGGGGDELLPVPAFARKVRVSGIVPGTPAGFVGYIRFFRDIQGAQPICEYLFTENMTDFMAIPAGSYYFAFVTGAANIDSMQAVFELAI